MLLSYPRMPLAIRRREQGEPVKRRKQKAEWAPYYWTRLIRKIYDVGPRVCPRWCSGQMRLAGSLEIEVSLYRSVGLYHYKVNFQETGREVYLSSFLQFRRPRPAPKMLRSGHSF